MLRDGVAKFFPRLVTVPVDPFYEERALKPHGGDSGSSGACGLSHWKTNSIITHATAATPTGPFHRSDVALATLAHDAAPTRANDGTWLLFHIGTANATQVPACNSTATSRYGPGAADAGAGVSWVTVGAKAVSDIITRYGEGVAVPHVLGDRTAAAMDLLLRDTA